MGSSWSSLFQSKPNWLQLPQDLTINILQRLNTFEIATSARNVCSLWWNICKEPLMWRTIRMSNVLSRYDFKYTYKAYSLLKICLYAIDKSCGYVEEIDIEYLATDHFLRYIASRGSHLRSIRLAKCHKISNEVLSEVVQNFPLLEEIDISGGLYLNAVTIENLGRCCPLLKSMKYSCSFIISSCYDDAFAIANTMSGLRHLQILGNMITNDGLLAILDRCSQLESLDLRGCVNLDLSGCLGKRCYDQIKYLRLRNDLSLDDSFDGEINYHSDSECVTSDEDIDGHEFGWLYS